MSVTIILFLLVNPRIVCRKNIKVSVIIGPERTFTIQAFLAVKICQKSRYIMLSLEVSTVSICIVLP